MSRVPARPRHTMKLTLQVLFLSLLSAGLELAWIKAVPFGATYDSSSYVGVARWMLHMPPHMWNIIEYYSKGFPALLVLGGIFWNDSFAYVKLFFFIMAAAMPSLVFVILRAGNRHAAFPGALLLIISGMPYIYSWDIMSDQLHVFLLLCSIGVFTRVMQSRSIGWVIAFAVLISMTWYVRPISILIPGLFILILMIYRGSPWQDLRHNLVHSAIIAAITFGIFIAGSAYHSDLEKRPFKLGVTQNYSANQALMAYYVLAPTYFAQVNHRAIEPLIVPENGPATARLFEMFREVVRKTNSLPGIEEAKSFNGDVDAFTQEMINHPRLIYFYHLVWQLDGLFKTDVVDKVIQATVKEALSVHPGLVRYMIWNFLQGLGSQSWGIRGDGGPFTHPPYSMPGDTEFHHSLFVNLVGPRALSELTRTLPSAPVAQAISDWLERMVGVTEKVKPYMAIIAIVGFVLTVRRRNYILALCVGGMFYYPALQGIIMIFQLRYAYPIVVLMIMAGALAIAALAELVVDLTGRSMARASRPA